jgi:hypothetical protein
LKVGDGIWAEVRNLRFKGLRLIDGLIFFHPPLKWWVMKKREERRRKDIY